MDSIWIHIIWIIDHVLYFTSLFFSNTSFISNMGRIRFNEDFVRYADFGAQNVAIRSEYLYYIFLRIR